MSCQQQIAALVGREALLHASELEFVLQPQPLVGVRDVGELGADVAAVDGLEPRDDLAQRRALGHPVVAACGVELRVEIRIAEARVVEVEHARARALQQPQRIDVRDQVPAVAVDLHQPRHGGLLFTGHGIRSRARRRHRTGLRTRSDRGDHRTVGALGAAAGDEFVEIATPTRFELARIAQVLFVQRLDEAGVSVRKRWEIRGFWHGWF